MFELSHLADRRRPRCSLILLGCLISSVALIGCLFSHSYVTATVSRVFLNVQQNVGLFSVEQYALFGGEEGRSRAKEATIYLGDWERRICPTGAAATGELSLENLESPNNICRYVTTLRGAGVVTCVLKIATCVFLVFGLHDLWFVARTDDTFMTTAALLLDPVSGGPITSMGATPTTDHGGPEQQQEMSYYIPAAEASRVWSATNVTRMPTVLALRTLQSVDGESFLNMHQLCKDRLQRCVLSLRVAFSLLCLVITVWLLALVRAFEAKRQLADFLTTWGEEEAPNVPISIRLGLGFYTPLMCGCLIAIFLRLHKTLLMTDFKLVYQAGLLGGNEEP